MADLRQLGIWQFRRVRRCRCRCGGDGGGPAGCLGGLAGFQGDHVVAAGAQVDGGPQARQQVPVLLMAVQEQNPDQGLRSIDLAELPLGHGPERLVLGGERALRAGLVECLGAIQGAGLAQQHLQIVVQDQVLQTAAGEPGMAGDLAAAREDDQHVAGQVDSDLVVDESDRDGVGAHLHRDPAVAVDPRLKGHRSLERIHRQRQQVRRLPREVLADGADP
ncbi:hypothetical protein FNH08_01850 [Streptomyces spongiae]|uniref:Uncharacterized protein n=1 Tax=Streptomyces spongiae TaxID=565072 RepID=A0A5N8XBS5_9ACTN|nr:hypothetical protein [Streptomyces spongiae]MPY55975.1 hypothetical protein [Streptomyces spongiae]